MNFDPREAMTIMLDDVLPEYPSFDPAYRRAPRREAALTQAFDAVLEKDNRIAGKK